MCLASLIITGEAEISGSSLVNGREVLNRELEGRIHQLLQPHRGTGIVLRGGFSHEGTPIGVRIAGKWFDEAAILRAAHAYEQARTDTCCATGICARRTNGALAG